MMPVFIIDYMEPRNTETIDVIELALKWSTKEEVYKVLTISGKVYLPPVQQVNWDFIHDLLWGDKKVYSILIL